MDDPNWRTIDVPVNIPCVTITTGTEAHTFAENFRSEDGCTLRPIEKVVLVARLRELANQIEGAS